MALARRDFLFGMGALASVPWTSPRAAADTLDAVPSVLESLEGSLTIQDDVGQHLVVKSPMTRFVVFNRYTAEFVRALAGNEIIVGVGAEIAKDIAYWPNLHASVTGEGQSQPNYEAIVATRPDAVLMPRNTGWDTGQRLLAPFDIPVIVITAWDILKHEANISLLGELSGKTARAAELNAFYRHYRDLLVARTAGLQRKRVYLEEVGNYKTVLKGSGWHDMIELAGGINIFGDLAGSDQRVSRGNIQSFDIDPEEIAARKPDIMIKLQPSQYAPHTKDFSIDVLKAIAARPCCARLPAIEAGEVYHISYFLAGGCSKIIGALQLAKWLYPQEFADVDPGKAMRIWLEHYQSVPYPGGYWVSLAQIRS